MSKTVKKGKKGKKMCWRALSVFVVALGLASTGQAAGFGWNDEPLRLDIGSPSMQFDPNSVENRGGALMVNYGALAKADLGANRFRLGLLTIGLGVQSGVEAGQPMTGTQVGVLLGCSTTATPAGAYLNDVCLGGKYDVALESWLVDIQLPIVYRWVAQGGALVGL